MEGNQRDRVFLTLRLLYSDYSPLKVIVFFLVPLAVDWRG